MHLILEYILLNTLVALHIHPIFFFLPLPPSSRLPPFLLPSSSPSLASSSAFPPHFLSHSNLLSAIHIGSQFCAYTSLYPPYLDAFFSVVVYRSLSIKPDASTLHYFGALYFNTGRHREAMEVFQQALKLEPGRVETICSYVRESLTSVYSVSSPSHSPLQCSKKLLSFSIQGQTLVQLRREERAIEVLLEATQMHPKAGCLHLTLANSFAQQKALNKVHKVIYLSTKCKQKLFADNKNASWSI